MPRRLRCSKEESFSAVDLFCGAGGLSYGLKQAGIQVVAGVDLDPNCAYPFEENVGASFLLRDVAKTRGSEIRKLLSGSKYQILAGCAPCQPYSRYTRMNPGAKEDTRWNLLGAFARIALEIKPTVVTMENVPGLARHHAFGDFVESLRRSNYFVSWGELYCPDFGVPQSRTRLVLFASRFGRIELPKPTHFPGNFRTVRDAIGPLASEELKAGEQCGHDPMHICRGLSSKNLKRIRAAVPGGTWRDWSRALVSDCHRKPTGRTYPSVYGRMEWDAVGPTITTQFFGFGNGRFGHPTQDRALSLREGALLQSFPVHYRFARLEEQISMQAIGKLIGNAVPPLLARAIGFQIKRHIKKNARRSCN